jgi:hypothetical protein
VLAVKTSGRTYRIEKADNLAFMRVSKDTVAERASAIIDPS